MVETIIREVELSDAQQIANIYNYYIEKTVITFEEQLVSANDIQARIEKIKKADHIWLVAEFDSQIVGYAYSAPWRDRSAYRYASEVSVYLSSDSQGKGIGSLLYQSLFEQLKLTQIKILIGGITLPNEASVAIHEKFGMEKVAHFREVGYKFDQWLDVGYWQVKLS
ncbi:GNAT family N-acetyltransferase [Colwellia sp. 1_MG-2023]|uniref:GNAT family N-acetyltransferase n=1 Tax=Colwellia sp. 1_MG-2023 TaxID=3062649 RepID=UPI0026E2BABB|nr:GNAT family N-acetyltransferase [Colwellia sp. 1_MG-2023]MDO6446905.1 GNAT family N-acetyltransferase [Colwellia sp. 1_MG-2023]